MSNRKGKVICNDPNILKFLYLLTEKKMLAAHAADVMGLPRPTAYGMKRILSDQGLLQGSSAMQGKCLSKAGPAVQAVLSWNRETFLWFCEQWPNDMNFHEFVSSFVIDAYMDEKENAK